MPHNDLLIVDNSAEEKTVKSYLQKWCQFSRQMDIATGYLEIGGLLDLDGEWQKLDKIRITLHKLDSSTIKYYGSELDAIESIEYKEEQIIINHECFFQNVSVAEWGYTIGSYQPLQKWMKDRKGCALSSDGIFHYSQMITAVKRSIEIMDEIDQIIQ